MSKIKVLQGNLFLAPPGSVLVHSCNAQGTWGAGIAKEFYNRFPEAFVLYREHCLKKGRLLLGESILVESRGYKIASLITSSGYGRMRDSAESILKMTEASLFDLSSKLVAGESLHMGKINSGLFGVPWNKTVEILERIPREIIVYELGRS